MCTRRQIENRTGGKASGNGGTACGCKSGAFGERQKPFRRAEEKLLETVGLHADASQELLENGKNLSGGQRQRVAIARALAREKKILFMDEATANLDARSSQKIEDMVLESDKTVVLITHKLTDETQGRLDRVIEL